MAVLLLRNLDTREHVGFLAWVLRDANEVAQLDGEGNYLDRILLNGNGEKFLREMAAKIDDEDVKKVYLSNASSTHSHFELIRQDYDDIYGM